MTAPLLGVDLNLFGEDGSETAPTSAGAPGPLPPGVDGDTLGTGVGEYACIGDRKFRFSFYRLITKNGVLSGYQRVKGTIAVSASGKESTDHAKAEFFDLNWNLVFTAETDAFATKLATPHSRDND